MPHKINVSEQSQPFLINLRKNLMLPANNEKLGIYSIVELKGENAKVSIIGKSVEYFTIHLKSDCLDRNSSSFGLFLKEGIYRTWLNNEELYLYPYKNNNNNVFYSFYSFFGKFNNDESTIDGNLLFGYEAEDGKGNCYLFAGINPLVEEGKDVIAIDKNKTTLKYSITKDGKIHRIRDNNEELKEVS